MTQTVLADTRGAFLLLTLSKPEKLYALDPGMLAAIAGHLQAVDSDERIAATIITGAGRAFSSGFDMSGGGLANPRSVEERARANLESFLSIWHAHKPVVAAVHGYALGAGCILACLCDLVLASEQASFGEPEIRYFNPARVTILPWIVGVRRAKQLLMLGNKLDARTALEYGIVNAVLPVAGFLDAALAWARPLAHRHPASLAAVKRSVNRGMEIGGFLEALRAGVEQIAPLYAAESPTASLYRPEIERLGLRAYVRQRDDLLGA